MSVGCIPYSQQACQGAGEILGLEKGGNGYRSEGDYNIKGCYAYSSGVFKGRWYYGVNENTTIEQMKEPTRKQGTYRPKGYDCFGNSK